MMRRGRELTQRFEMAKAFEALTSRGQVARLKAMGQAALAAWPVEQPVIHRSLAHGENTTFEVRGLLDGQPERFVLRVHRPGYHPPEEIRDELRWLDALAADTTLRVPQPVHTRDGALLTTAAHEGIPEARTLTLMRWVEGRFAWNKPTPAQIRRLGALLGHLHDHAQRWPEAATLQRPVWDTEGLFGPGCSFGDPRTAPGLSPRDLALIEDVRAQLIAALDALPRTPDTFGLVHCDLHLGNVLFADAQACPIDFDDCCHSWLMHDLGISWHVMNRYPDHTDTLRDALLDGYTTVRTLPPDALDQLTLFSRTREVVMLGWIASRADNPRLAAHLPRVRERVVGLCAAWTSPQSPP